MYENASTLDCSGSNEDEETAEAEPLIPAGAKKTVNPLPVPLLSLVNVSDICELDVDKLPPHPAPTLAPSQHVSTEYDVKEM
jgi:hypothetical protein